jgi:hypothetical protein
VEMKRAAMKRLASWRPGGVLVSLVFCGLGAAVGESKPAQQEGEVERQ